MHSGLMTSCYLLKPQSRTKIRDALQGVNNSVVRLNSDPHYHRFSVLTPDMTSSTVVMLHGNQGRRSGFKSGGGTGDQSIYTYMYVLLCMYIIYNI